MDAIVVHPPVTFDRSSLSYPPFENREGGPASRKGRPLEKVGRQRGVLQGREVKVPDVAVAVP